MQIENIYCDLCHEIIEVVGPAYGDPGGLLWGVSLRPVRGSDGKLKDFHVARDPNAKQHLCFTCARALSKALPLGFALEVDQS